MRNLSEIVGSDWRAEEERDEAAARLAFGSLEIEAMEAEREGERERIRDYNYII